MIAALPTPEKRTLYKDTSTRGLAIQVMPSGSKTFYFYRKVKGNPIQKPLGAFPDISIERARDKAHEQNVDVLNDKDPAEAARRARDEQTFGDLFNWWFATFSKDRKKTADLDAMIGRLYLDSLMSRKLSTITKTDLSQLHAHRANPWVFPSHGRTGLLVEPKRGWAALLERAGIEDLRLHDLRRTLGSWMIDTGASLAVIGKTLGHKSPSATAVYARLSMQSIRDAKARAVEALHQARAGEVQV